MAITTEIAWEQFSRILYSFITKRIKIKDDAEDILQDVFYRIHKGIGNLKDYGKLKQWIFAITRNAIIDYYKANRQQESINLDPEAFIENIEDYDLVELEKCLIKMTNKLPEPYRDAVQSCDLQQEKQKDYAQSKGLSHSGVKSRVQRGRTMLKELIRNCCNFEMNEKRQFVSGYEGDAKCKCAI